MPYRKHDTADEKKELSAKNLAHYLGCFMIFNNEKDNPLVLDAISTKEYHPIQCVLDGEGFELGWLVKPVLRPLSDITDEEMAQLSKNIDASTCSSTFYDSPLDVDSLNQFLPINTKYLLSRYFDLFGWIDVGLAIDATTLSPNPYKINQ